MFRQPRTRQASFLHNIVFLALLLTLFAPALPAHAIECSFTNPLIEPGYDPSVVYKEGVYYLLQSVAGSSLTLIRSETLTGLGSAQPTTIYTPPGGQPYSYDLWAPELIVLDDEWYIYVAATDAPGNNASHRMYVLQADTDDPFGSWTVQGQVADFTNDRWAIDGNVFEYDEQLYMVWSGWPTQFGDFPQNLYIAEMSDPLTISGPRHLISEPDQAWERSVARINEGPQPFIYEDQLSIVYAADASWTSAYKLGLLQLVGDDPLDRESWIKVGPVFNSVTDTPTPVYAPGHSSNPVLSPDGEEWWFFYHANREANGGWDGRDIRAQEFTWTEDGLPLLDAPIPAAEAVPVPSGEPCGLIASFDEVMLLQTGETLAATPSAATPSIAETASPTATFVDLGEPLLFTQGSFSIAAQVQLVDVEGEYAFVSQEGGLNSNFVLGLTDGRFTFTMNDGLGQNAVSTQSTFTPEIGRWYILAGVYDAATQQLVLYADGELQGSVAFTAPWDARGSTVLGAALRRGQRTAVFNGSLRAVQLYAGALSVDEVAGLGEA